MAPRLTAAFDELFEREYPRLVRALTLIGGDGEAAADSVQDAFVQAHRHWGRISGYTDPAGWVRRAALHRLANRRRGDRRRARFVVGTQVALARGGRAPGMSGPAATPDDVDLARAVAALPAQQRTAIALHYLADLSVQEVALAMSVAPGTVKSHLSDARHALARHPALASEEPTHG